MKIYLKSPYQVYNQLIDLSENRAIFIKSSSSELVNQIKFQLKDAEIVELTKTVSETKLRSSLESRYMLLVEKEAQNWSELPKEIAKEKVYFLNMDKIGLEKSEFIIKNFLAFSKAIGVYLVVYGKNEIALKGIDTNGVLLYTSGATIYHIIKN
jgi:hypothetical protein